MSTKKIVGLIVGCVAVAALVVYVLFFAHAIGNTPATTVEHEGGSWEKGASAGRAWSQYSHPTQWHYAVVDGREREESDCVAPGEIARAAVEQSRIGRNSFEAGFCEEDSAQMS